MPTYASSAPATDAPYKELDEFPSVAEIAQKIKMNPLAPSFSPKLVRSASKPQNIETSEGLNEDHSSNHFHHPDEMYHEASSEYDIEATAIPPEHGLDIENALLQGPLLSSSYRYQSNTRIPVWSSLSPDQDVSIPSYHAASNSPHNMQYSNQLNAIAMSSLLDQPESDPDNSTDPADFDYAYKPRYGYQQNATPSYAWPTPSPSTSLTQQPHSLYPTHLYGRPHPANPQFVLPFKYANPPFYPRLGSLPPSYPFPHLTPPDSKLPVPESSTPARHIRLHPYNNVPMAEHYLSLFTDLYGTSPTSLPSLHAICLTLSHPPETLPKTIRNAQKYIKRRYVNIFDLVDYGVKGEAVPEEFVFLNAQELRRYSEETRKVCPAEVGRGTGEAREEDRGNELWRWMLRKWY